MKIYSFFSYLVLLFPFCSIASDYNEKAVVSFDTVRVQDRVGLAIKISNLPGQSFVLEIPEIITLRDARSGLFNYSNQRWTYSNKGAEMKFEDGEYRYFIKLTTESSKKATNIKWNMDFENKTKKSLYDIAAFNCWTMNTAPLFKDLKMERTFVTDASGKRTALKEVRKTQGDGRRSMQFYSSVEGVDLSHSPWISQWNVISAQDLSSRKLSVVSTDGKWVFENQVNGKVAYFFNNWEEDHGCVHASPLLANELKPGETARVSGSFRFTKSHS
jgi:hypothetical protein